MSSHLPPEHRHIYRSRAASADPLQDPSVQRSSTSTPRQLIRESKIKGSEISKDMKQQRAKHPQPVRITAPSGERGGSVKHLPACRPAATGGPQLEVCSQRRVQCRQTCLTLVLGCPCFQGRKVRQSEAALIRDRRLHGRRGSGKDHVSPNVKHIQSDAKRSRWSGRQRRCALQGGERSFCCLMEAAPPTFERRKFTTTVNRGSRGMAGNSVPPESAGGHPHPYLREPQLNGLK
ncbi:uncharacterized protein LOC125749252 [Brienomyrus brachyistius]|uniref:uncharacterized protein LOC125749252 n=1 Tax=Brienomyrus brachyistius TaxID=42636 RepID=UPI0020B41526|nr:uncharacterized protein LOC125749252 [Brienomyrus brachyistius]